MNVLVLGGTRYFGIPMVNELVNAGHEVTIATRGRAADPFGASVKRITLDRTNPESLREALAGRHYDVVIWCDRAAFPYDEIKRQAEYALWQAYPDRNWVAVRYPFVIGGDDVIAMLKDLNRIKPVWVELGLQTADDATARRINRCYDRSVFEDAYQRLKEAGLTVIVHLIFGLPGEDEETMLDSVRYLSNLNPRLDGVKLQLLQILRGTKIAEEFAEEPWHAMTLGEYANLLVKALRILPKETIVHRITGDGPKKLLIEPRWCADKKHVMNTLHKAIDRAEK